jgi:hypothetical protein
VCHKLPESPNELRYAGTKHAAWEARAIALDYMKLAADFFEASMEYPTKSAFADCVETHAKAVADLVNECFEFCDEWKLIVVPEDEDLNSEFLY